MNIFNKLLDFLFPDMCLGCGQEGTLVCATCIHAVPRAHEAEYDFIHPLFSYQSPIIKGVVWRLKYKNTQRAASLFGKNLYEKLLEVLSDELSFSPGEQVLLVPIPLHPTRERERGYNQSMLLVQALKAHDTHNVCRVAPDILTRTRETNAQARSEKRNVRFENLSNAFTCADPSRVRGMYVVLIDDVTTTGATLIEAKRTLEKAKARTVIAITLAH